jgi:hypothetical protein
MYQNPVTKIPTLTDSEGRVYQLDTSFTVIGSGKTSGVVIDEAGVAETQAELVFQDNQWTLINRCPDNVVMINGQAISNDTQLKHNDIITVGSATLTFMAPEAESIPQAPVSGGNFTGYPSGGVAQPPPAYSPSQPSGQNQKLCLSCHSVIFAAAEICPHCGVRQYVPNAGPVAGKHNRTTAGLLAILIGGLGVHKFYLGQTGMGVLYILFCWTYIPAIVAFIEGIMYFSMSEEQFVAKYG